MDQAGPIVDRFEPYPVGQPRGDVLDPCLDVVDDVESVLAETLQGDVAGGVAHLPHAAVAQQERLSAYPESVRGKIFSRPDTLAALQQLALAVPYVRQVETKCNQPAVALYIPV